MSTAWHRIDTGGVGRPLVLLHAAGSSSDSWLPVIAQLARERRVIAFDLPGFGATPAPADMQFSATWIVEQLVAQLAETGIETPVDLVGNSLGGWVALEAAKAGVARSVVALGPAGLWRHGMPRELRLRFRLMLIGSAVMRGRASGLMRFRVVRRAVQLQVLARPDRLSAEAVRSMAGTFDHSRTTLVPLLRAARSIGFRDGHSITAPVTVAFGTHERWLRRSSGRLPDHLPAHTQWLELPGCGHVPMSDDPHLVAATILTGCS